MERINRSLKGHYWRKVITYFLTCCLLFNTSLPAVMATPTGGVVDISDPRNGNAEILYNQGTYEHTTQVNVETTSTIINWESLDTAGGAADVRETLAFSQGSLANSAVLNRISGPATHFDGDLSAPGMRIFMVNPAGILFGSGSTVNVTQLVASGLNMSNNAFNNYLDDPVNNKMEFADGNGNISSRAYITADSVFLIGKKVFNVGPIVANEGLVVMAAGDEVRLYENGSDVSVLVSGLGDGDPDIRNSGNVSVINGKIVLAAGDTFSRAIRNVSILAASGGEVSIQAAKVENNGWIFANSSSGNGGSISLTGSESVTVGPDGLGTGALIEANAGPNGDGGSITIQTDGLFRIDDKSSISASGGSVSGNGGSVTINCKDFEILGDISASPGNKINEPGKLEINTPSDVLIADGANAGVTNTLYEDDIEVLSQGATSLIVNTEGDITVQNITDTTGNGEITGQFGDIELHATGDDSIVTFEDNTDTIRTTLGDIVIEAGSGGINAGNLTTGKDLPDEKPAPGQIFLTTHNGGNITTGDLIVRDGWGDGEDDAEIDVKSSGNLTVNGDVMVGSESSPILNVADERAAEAVIILNADNDVTLNGTVEAHAHGSEVDTSITKAYIDVSAGNNANINGDLLAKATSSSSGTADAVIKVEAVGDVVFAVGAEAHAIANGGAAEAGPGTESEEETSPDGDHAQIIINDSAIFLVDDSFSMSKSASDVVLDVLANDTLEEGSTIDSHYIDPAEGSLTTDTSGDPDVLIYNPPEDLSALTFDENGEAVVTFTYTVSGKTATGTVTLINGLPVAIADKATAFLNRPVTINVLKNDTDPDSGDVLTAIEGTLPKNGTLVLNENGTFTYTPNEGYLGDDSFTYAITDGANTSAEVEVKITVSEEPPALPGPSAPSYMPLAPGLDSIGMIKIDISGSTALAKWVAKELGVDEKIVHIWIANSLSSPTDIQPYESYSNLRKAALILQDADGTHIAALVKVINEFASSTAPPTEEQMAAIADAITRNTNEDSHYAIANEYLDALVTYVGILSSEMGFSTTESVQIVTDKYISRLTRDQNVGVAAFLAASLAALGG
jgi:filamentous hemagglutinin family protein